LRSRAPWRDLPQEFGAPSFTAAGELFWGNDRLEQALTFARTS
jgi:hypothetical protein